MSFISSTLSILVATIIVVPLFAYVIGLVIPASHIVSRSSNFETSSKKLWEILTNVSNYPQWQSKVEKVTIQELDYDNNKTVFTEHSTRKRQTVIIHHKRILHQCLLRILEERPSVDGQRKIPTFSGSWTFEITNDNKQESRQVTLKITEQGVIKKPIVRVMHLMLFGFHRRIDRFMNDLHALIDNNKELQVPTQQELFYSSVSLQGDTDREETTAVQKTDDLPDQLLDANDTSMTESKLISGWDLVSEVYARPVVQNS